MTYVFVNYRLCVRLCVMGIGFAVWFCCVSVTVEVLSCARAVMSDVIVMVCCVICSVYLSELCLAVRSKRESVRVIISQTELCIISLVNAVAVLIIIFAALSPEPIRILRILNMTTTMISYSYPPSGLPELQVF